MRRYMQRFLYIGLLVTVMWLLISSFAYASDGTTKYQNTLIDTASQIKIYCEALIGVSAIFTAILYMASFANPSSKDLANKSLYSLIIGIFLLALYSNIASWIYDLIGMNPNNLATAMGTNIKKVIVNVKYDNEDDPSSDGGRPVPYRTILLAARNDITKRNSASYAADQQVTIQIPTWTLQGGQKVSSTKSVQVHKLLADHVKGIFTEIYNDPEKFPIKSIGGYRWPDSYPNHPAGMAIDINPDENPMMTIWGSILVGDHYSPGSDPYSMGANCSVVRIFRKYGWDWGGLWHTKKDYMHFSILGG